MKRWITVVLLAVCLVFSACGEQRPVTTGPSGETTAPTETTQAPTKATEPAPTELTPTEPAPTVPAPTEPKPTEPAPTVPVPTEPKPTEPAPTEPAPTEPKPTEPAPTQPAPTEPAPTQPAPTEHVHNYITIVFEQSCTTDGCTQHQCTTCGECYISDYIGPAFGHDFTTRTVDPNCTEKGYTEYTCARCGLVTQGDRTPAIGHSWSSWTMIKEATYTERGVRRRECLTCGAVQEQYAPDPKLTDEQTRDAILALINEERKKAGLAALGYLTEAQTAADIRATEVRNGFCDIRANGTEGITVLQEQGIPYQNAGEIWAVVDGAHAPRTIVRNAWMSSEKYQKTILDPNFKSMAVGIKDNGWIVFFVG